MTTLVIGSKRFSTWSLRPWLALKMAGIHFEEVMIHLRQPDTKERVKKYSPSGKIPYLKNGTTEVWDSLAICEYAADLKPEAGLWPEDIGVRAHARSVAAEMHAGFMLMRQTLPMDVGGAFPTPEISPEVAAEIARVQAMWEDCRQKYAAQGPYLFGKFSIADAMYAPVVTRFSSYGVKVSPVVAEYMQTIWAIPFMQEWKKAADGERE